VVQGDRLDNLAARYFGDAELYWRLCDANGAVRPTGAYRSAGDDHRRGACLKGAGGERCLGRPSAALHRSGSADTGAA
jgi:hypothetical protein